MDVEIQGRPAFAHMRVRMNPDDRIIAESDAMASMSTTIDMQTRFNGGFVGGVAKKFLGGESLFVNEFVAGAQGELVLTQPTPGDIVCVEMTGNTLYLQPGAFIACETGVTLGVGFAGFASFIGKEGLFRLKVGGQGRVWFGAYGGIFTRDIDGEYVVDTGHLVAYEPTLTVKVGMAGGLITSMASGEGLISRISGKGKIHLQSRSLDGLASWANGYI